MKTTRHAPNIRIENLDVPGRSHEQGIRCGKGTAGEMPSDADLSVVRPYATQVRKRHKPRRPYRVDGSKYISVTQATNIVEAVKFAKSIGLALVAHATIHWSGTVAFDDHDGSRFARVREGLNKVLRRRGIPGAYVWCRECKAHTDIVHCHLLFHLPAKYRNGAKLDGIKAALDRLVDRHGDGILGEFAVKLVIWPDPDGLYLIKGGGLKVWKKFPRIQKAWRQPQGVIHGKRCGTSQNIGRVVREKALTAVDAAKNTEVA